MIEVEIVETAGLRIGTTWFELLFWGDNRETKEQVLEESRRLRNILKKILESTIVERTQSEKIFARVNSVAPYGDKVFSFIVDCPSSKKDKAREIIQEITSPGTSSLNSSRQVWEGPKKSFPSFFEI